jgi:hypothetical protein
VSQEKVKIHDSDLEAQAYDVVIDGFEMLIASALQGGKPERFKLVMQLARQAEELRKLSAKKPTRLAGYGIACNVNPGGAYAEVGGDGDDDNTGYANNIIGNIVDGYRGQGAQDEILRQVIDALGPMMNLVAEKTRNDARRDLNFELRELIETRATLVRNEDSDLKVVVQDRIDKIREEMRHGLVSAKFLRGHHADGRDERDRKVEKGSASDEAGLASSDATGETGSSILCGVEREEAQDRLSLAGESERGGDRKWSVQVASDVGDVDGDGCSSASDWKGAGKAVEAAAARAEVRECGSVQGRQDGGSENGDGSESDCG